MQEEEAKTLCPDTAMLRVCLSLASISIAVAKFGEFPAARVVAFGTFLLAWVGGAYCFPRELRFWDFLGKGRPRLVRVYALTAAAWLSLQAAFLLVALGG